MSKNIAARSSKEIWIHNSGRIPCMKARRVLWLCLVTVVFSRLLSLILYYSSNSGKTALWNNWFLNTFDEYQFGFLLIVLSYFFDSARSVLFAIGIGLIIAEADQVLHVFSFDIVPYEFHSILDWLCTLI